jgi:hypothetical protein
VDSSSVSNLASGGSTPPSWAARNAASPGGAGTPIATANRRGPSGPRPGNSTASGSADTTRSSRR